MANYAVIQRLHDEGKLDLDELRRLGATHKAYGWTPCLHGPQWSDEQRAAYREGYDAAEYNPD